MSNQYYFFGTRTTFIQAAPKIFRRVNGTLKMVAINQVANWSERTQQTSMVHQFLNEGISDTADLSSNINDLFC